MDAVCDLSIGGVGFGCVGNIAILALIVLIFVAAAVYCVCFRKRRSRTRRRCSTARPTRSGRARRWPRRRIVEETGLMSATSRSPSERPSARRAAEHTDRRRLT